MFERGPRPPAPLRDGDRHAPPRAAARRLHARRDRGLPPARRQGRGRRRDHRLHRATRSSAGARRSTRSPNIVSDGERVRATSSPSTSSPRAACSRSAAPITTGSCTPSRPADRRAYPGADLGAVIGSQTTVWSSGGGAGGAAGPRGRDRRSRPHRDRARASGEGLLQGPASGRPARARPTARCSSAAGIDPAEVEYVIAGCVQQFGQQAWTSRATRGCRRAFRSRRRRARSTCSAAPASRPSASARR